MTNFPETWWQANRPLIFAHRGVNHAVPENTLSAFRRAVDVGADGVELDVHLTRDGVPVVIHDETVDATTDGTGRVTEMTLSEVKALDAGAYVDPAFAGTRVPTLEEVLAEIGHQLLVNIELKPAGGRNGGLAPAVVGVVRQMGLEDRVWFSSFKPHHLFQARQSSSMIPCGLLYSPLNPLTPLFRLFTPHDALHPYHGMITPKLVERAHGRGLRVSTWTVDDVATARRLADWGVDAVITNEPERLLTAFNAE